MREARFALPILCWLGTNVLSCAHRPVTTGPPELRWAERVARRDRIELDYRPPQAQVGCFRVHLGPGYLSDASTGTERVFIPNPGFIELSSDWQTDRIDSGFRVRTLPGSTPWRDGGVWWPTLDGGAIIRLGDGFFGMSLVVHLRGSVYSGKAATFQDVGYASQRTSAELWRTPCGAAEPGAAADPRSVASDRQVFDARHLAPWSWRDVAPSPWRVTTYVATLTPKVLRAVADHGGTISTTIYPPTREGADKGLKS